MADHATAPEKEGERERETGRGSIFPKSKLPYHRRINSYENWQEGDWHESYSLVVQVVAITTERSLGNVVNVIMRNAWHVHDLYGFQKNPQWLLRQLLY